MNLSSFIKTAGFIALTLFLFTLNLPASDVSFYAVLKGQLFQQNSAGTPVPDGSSNAVLQAIVELANEDVPGVNSASLVLLNHAEIPLAEEGDEFYWEQTFASVSALEAAYPNGAYQLVMDTVNDGRRTNTLALSGGFLPVPHFSNFAAAQAVDPTQDFTLTWDPIAGGTTNDFLEVQIRTCVPAGSDDSDEVFFTPDLGEPGALNGTSTSITVRARTLRPGQAYTVELLVARSSTLDTASYPGGQGLAAYFNRVQTTLTTTGTPTGCSRGELNLAFNYQHGFFNGTNGEINFPVGLSYYYANFNIDGETDYPTNVTFTGPAGSGLSNTTNQYGGFGFEGSAYYSSPSIPTPPFPPGGIYTVNYKGTNLSWNFLDPQAGSQQVILVPNVVVDASNILRQINWSYRDGNGHYLPLPSFVASVDLSIDGVVGGRLYDASSDGDGGNFLTLNSTNHVLNQTVVWTNVISLFMTFHDVPDNRYTSYWLRLGGSPANPAPFLNSFQSLPNREFEISFPGQNGRTYRLEGSTNLAFTNWTALQTTNANSTNGNVYFKDAQAPNFPRRFYRAVLLP